MSENENIDLETQLSNKKIKHAQESENKKGEWLSPSGINTFWEV